MRRKLLQYTGVLGLLLICSCRIAAQHFSFSCARDTAIPACLPGGCFTLKHKIPDLKSQTTSYTINPSGYNQVSGCVPEYLAPNNPSGTPTNLVNDDTNTPSIAIGFPFVFYGATYNSLVANTNGNVTFDLTRANATFTNWAINADLPSANYDRAVIFGPFHDIDPNATTSPTQRIQYQTWGVAPHRRWILSFYRVPLFSAACNPLIQNTHQIILYESTGIIEVTIFSKQICNTWNNGRAIVGIQNFARNQGMMAPGRAGIANPPWSVSAPGESWRFVPAGGSSLLKRVELLNSSGSIVATGTTADLGNGSLEASFPNVCPPAGGTTTYIVRSVYEKIDDAATEIFGYDTIRVNRTAGLTGSASFSYTSCGNNVGVITVGGVTGGAGVYQYSLNGGPLQASNVFSGLAPGNYTVTVNDGGLPACTLTLNITVPATAFLTATASVVNSLCAAANNGSITIATPRGGTGYTVTVSNGVGTFTDVTMPYTISNLPAGNYQITVSHPASGCNLEFPLNVEITQGQGVTGEVVTYTPASCFFASNGSATIRPTSGNGPFTITLSPSGTVIPNVNGNYTLTNLPGGPGNSVVFQDALGCNSPPIPLIVPSGNNSSVANATQSCGGANGTITVTPTGGVPPYTYRISPDNGTTWGPWVTDSVFTGLAPGNYLFQVRHGDVVCLSQTTATVSAGTALTANVSSTGVPCGSSAPTGTITVTPTAGTGPYEYSLDGTTWQSSNTFTGLAAGSYTVYYKESGGCPGSQPVTINTVPLSGTATSTGTSCSAAANGTITITIPGAGSNIYTFTLDGGIQVLNGTSPFTFNNVASGSHSIVVSNALPPSCASAPISVSVPAGGALNATMVTTPTTCPGATNGSIIVTPDPGGSPYLYTLDGSISVTSGGVSYPFTGLSAGNHTIVVTNVYGCVTTTYNVIVPEGPPLTANTATTGTTCGLANGSISISAPTGGTSPYQYSLDGITWQSGTGFSNLPAGTYTIRIRDNNSVCTLSIPNVIVAGSSSITAGTQVTNASCGANNGVILVTNPAGGTAPYQYSIDGGTSWQPSATFLNLAPGSYTITIRDAGAPMCTTTLSNIVVSLIPPLVASGANPIIATCGNSNGSIVVNAPGGGTPPYQYSIDGGTNWQASPSFFGLAPGSYTVTIRDAAATPCTGTVNNITVSGTTAITASGTTTTQATCGNPNGSITVNPPTGGTPPYQYSINGGASWQSTTTFSGLAAGSYTITIRDAGATPCTSTISNVTVGQTSAVSATPLSTGASCGNANGSINVTGATGGTPPYEYSLDGVNWQAGTTFNGLTIGNYTVWVRDQGASCSSTLPVTVGGTTAVIAAGATAAIATCGANNGSITVNAPSGGTPPYQYSIDGGTSWQATSIFNGLAPGSYTITIRDAGATLCTTTINNISVGGTTAITATGTITTPASCGSNNGSITVNAPSGGTAPYQYSIDGGTTWQASPLFNGLAGGSYTIRIRDAGATVCSTTITNVNVAGTTAVTAAGATSSIASCGNSNGTITVNAPSGGTPPYQYSIDGGTNWQPLNVFTGLAAGSYTVTIRDAGATVCTAQVTNITVSQTTAVAAAGATSSIATCGANNGSITVNAPTGGTPPYQYSIDGGATWQASNVFNGLAPNTYSITIRDAGATTCTATINSITVSQTTAVTAAGASSTQATCGNPTGGITVNPPSGGTAPYQYSIDGGTTWQASNIFSGLASGVYTVTIRDAGATVCTTTINNINVGQTSAVSAAPTTTGATCGNANGTINVAGATGGTPPYQYSLDGVNWQASANFTGLAGGTYTVWVRDLGATCSTTIPVNLTQTAAVTATTSSTPTACGVTTGTITVNGTAGGTAPYQYSLDGVSWQASNVFNNLGVGNYTVRVRDNGAVCSTTLPVTITQTGSIAATTTSVQASCSGVNNGSITITSAGGSGPYTFSLDGGAPQAGTIPYTFTNVSAGAHTVVVADQGSGCSTNVLNVNVGAGAGVSGSATQTATSCPTAANGSVTVTATTGAAPYTFAIDGGAAQAGPGSYTFNNVSAGPHTVLITDNNGCTSTVNVTVAAGPSLAASGTTTATACSGINNGTITVTPSNGTGPFQYSLDGGAPVAGGSPYTFTGVAAGPHVVVVTDAAGCVSNLVNVTVTTGAGVSGTATSAATSCPAAINGTITITATLGTAPYTYALDGGVFQSGANPYTFTGVAAGPHTVVIRDNAGCTQTINTTVTAGPALSTTVTKTDALCNGGATGSITVTQPGSGVPPFQYSLDGITWQASNLFNGLTAATYTVYYRESGGCQGSQTVTITEPAAVAANGTVTAARCNGQSNGTITVTAAGGTGPYQYSIDGGTTWQAGNLFTVAAGNHTITIRDANNCSTTRNFTVTEPAVLTAVTATTQASCNGGNDGVITVTAAGGNAAYQYSVDGVSFQASNVFNVGPGAYTVTVRDNQGCITTATATITVGSNFVLVPQPDVTICEGRSAQLQVSSNATQFSWSPATGLSSTTIANPVASPATTTQYIVTATFGRCSGNDTIVVRVNPAPIPNAGPDGIVCYGQPYQLQGSGGVQYQWTPSNYLSSATIANPVASPPRQITYSLSILADANGCASLVSDQVTLGVNPPITVKTTPYDTIAYTGDQFPLVAVASDPTATNYTWSPSVGLSSSTVSNPDVTITAATGTILRYQVSATNAAGCRGDGFVTIRVYKGPDVYVPSGFTPNGDGRNDRLIPIPVGIERLSYFRVVNRWGQLVYSTSKLQEGWDGRLNGTEQPSAVYVWMFEGFTRDGKRLRKEGTAALIR